MVTTVESARDMIRGMNPVLQPGRFVFCSSADGEPPASLRDAALATFREAEGLSLLLHEDDAVKAGLSASAPMRQITLKVYSSLTGVGLTAAVATALAEESIACNIIAATLHDHIFVPVKDADRAMAVLARLQEKAAPSG